MSLIERSSHQIEDFTVISALGEGAYSFVKLCHHNYDNSKIPLVVKYVVRSRILTWCRRPDLGNRVPNEIAILHDLSKSPHPHLPHLQTFFSDSFFYYLIFDHHPTKDLFEFIEQNSFINDDTIRVIFKQLLVAIEYIHSVGIVHRDIKDENVLIDDSFHVTLIDFGSAAYCSSAPFKSFFGTTLYAAPEVLKGLSYEGKPQDMWQLGVLLYTLKFHENPYFTVDEILSNQTLKYPGLIHGDLIDLLNGLLDRNVDTRFEITKVLDHPWYSIQFNFLLGSNFNNILKYCKSSS
ncbi:kinase-like domain-containing protein [Globomyces pollinis-pini]|nr:kinase-like domain-containing protein [Globomyces pollinis-pini]